MLDEIELLVRRGHPEVVPYDLQIIPGLTAVGANHGDRRFAAERRIGQDDRVARAGVGGQRISHCERIPIRAPDSVQQQVHRCQPSGPVDQLVPAYETVAKMSAPVRVKVLGLS